MYGKDIKFYLQYQTLHDTKGKANEKNISSLIIFQIIFLIIVLKEERLSLAVLQILMRKHEYEVEI